ncbi:MAG TPA: septal ring lytic transglycosylase RlpA family protein, partial [Pseudacidobacterium sp.]|nr:septal ring lytic transglycosylase RlpA family protein [Pseudacidobacterium sp.]
MAGCSHKQNAKYTPPPPPVINAPSQQETTSIPAAPAESIAPSTETESSVAPGDAADENFVASHQPIYAETGTASWYGPPYHNRRGANGQIFDQNAMSAA